LIPFTKASQSVVNIHARTIRADGTPVNFSGKIYDKTIIKGKGIKYLAKTFTLPDVQPGTIIEYYYTVDYSEDYIFDSHWIVSNELFTKAAKFSLKPYSSYSQNFQTTLRWQGIANPPKPAGIDKIIRMEASDIAAFETEDFMPPENELKARVLGVKSRALLETKEPRAFAIEFDGPAKDMDSFEITLPPGYEVDDLPPAVDADYSFASYHSKSEVHGNQIRYTRSFEIKELSVPASRAAELKKFYRIIANDERSTAVLRTASH
jgi:hypothetical protein